MCLFIEVNVFCFCWFELVKMFVCLFSLFFVCVQLFICVFYFNVFYMFICLSLWQYFHFSRCYFLVFQHFCFLLTPHLSFDFYF